MSVFVRFSWLFRGLGRLRLSCHDAGQRRNENIHAGHNTPTGARPLPVSPGAGGPPARGGRVDADHRSESPELVLTLRAAGLSTHGGEVAFPGGRRDPEDRDLLRTALREAEEEVGLAPGMVEVVGPLSSLVSVHGIHVTPYVGLVPDYVEYRANDAEIASVFSVPLEFFCQDPREVTHRIDYQGQSWYIPSYRYGEYQIWGLTAIMIVELVNVVYDAGIEMRRAPAAFVDLSGRGKP